MKIDEIISRYSYYFQLDSKEEISIKRDILKFYFDELQRQLNEFFSNEGKLLRLEEKDISIDSLSFYESYGYQIYELIFPKIIEEINEWNKYWIPKEIDFNRPTEVFSYEVGFNKKSLESLLPDFNIILIPHVEIQVFIQRLLLPQQALIEKTIDRFEKQRKGRPLTKETAKLYLDIIRYRKDCPTRSRAIRKALKENPQIFEKFNNNKGKKTEEKTENDFVLSIEKSFSGWYKKQKAIYKTDSQIKRNLQVIILKKSKPDNSKK